MQAQDKRQFLAMLTDTLAAYGKPLPEGALLTAWWTNLEPFPLPAVAMALTTYRDENGEFAPVPAGIAKRCKLLDGRPSADEAWAIALTSRDEADTVIWTEETAEAFGICSPVLSMGDEVGARRAFIEAYNRLVTAARANGKPAKWNVSMGWDATKREAALTKAQTAGLLPAPAVRSLLPNYVEPGEPVQTCPEGLKRVKEELAKLQDANAKAERLRAERIEAARLATEQRKQSIAGQVRDYLEPEKVRA